MNVIETHNLQKVYGAKRAVDHFDMHVKQGDIFGFIGRNGAGKSTVMKLIAGLSRPSGGEIQLFGKTVSSTGAASERVGVLIENPGLYPRMSAYDNMIMKALCMGSIDPKASANQLLAYVGLDTTGKKTVNQFSMGMKQRLGLALALLGNPDILLLDEPLNGLDPEGVREIRQLIQRLNEEKGVTVLISSHVLEQLGKMATCYGVIRDGSMVRELSAAEVELECRDFILINVAEPARALALLTERIPTADFTVMPNESIRVFGTDNTALIGDVLKDEGIAVYGLHIQKRDLEDFFVEMMGAEYHV